MEGQNEAEELQRNRKLNERNRKRWRGCNSMNRQMPGDERIDRSAQGDHKEKQDGDQGDDDNEHDPEEPEGVGI